MSNRKVLPRKTKYLVKSPLRHKNFIIQDYHKYTTKTSREPIKVNHRADEAPRLHTISNFYDSQTESVVPSQRPSQK